MIEIREATRDDLPSVQDVLSRTWHETYDPIYGPERVAELTASWHVLWELEAQLERADFKRFVACDPTGLIIGTSGVSLADATLKLHQLYVLPDAQGHGTGRALFAAALAAFPNAKRVELEVEPENTSAVVFYHHMGLQEIGETSDCAVEGSGIRALILGHDLPLPGVTPD